MGQELDKVIASLAKEGVIKWTTSDGSEEAITLPDVRARRLVQTLLDGASSKLEADSGSAKEKIASEDKLFASLESGWLAAVESKPDEYADVAESITAPAITIAWVLEQVEASGFGGINGYSSTEPFITGISDHSECFLGGNGSGKSSLISAIAWPLTGKRINDSNGLSERSNTLHPVFDPAEPETKIGEWAPIATYPVDRNGYTKPAAVSVRLTFRKSGSEQRATIERKWTSIGAPETEVAWAPELESLKQCLDVAVEMPLKMAHLRLGEAGTLNDAISQLTGMDVLAHVGQLVSSLKIKSSRFLNTPKQGEHDQQRRDIERDFDKAATTQPELKLELIGLRSVTSWVEKPDEYFAAAEKLKAGLVSAVGSGLAAAKEYVDPALALDNEQNQKQIAAAISD